MSDTPNHAAAGEIPTLLTPMSVETVVEIADKYEYQDPESGNTCFDRLGFAQEVAQLAQQGQGEPEKYQLTTEQIIRRAAAELKAFAPWMLNLASAQPATCQPQGAIYQAAGAMCQAEWITCPRCKGNYAGIGSDGVENDCAKCEKGMVRASPSAPASAQPAEMKCANCENPRCLGCLDPDELANRLLGPARSDVPESWQERLYRVMPEARGYPTGILHDVGAAFKDEEIAEWRALAAPQQPAARVAVPDGYVLVPKTPTPEMIEAFGGQLEGACGSYFEWDRGGDEAYTAMLAASPATVTAPAQPLTFTEIIAACEDMLNDRTESSATATEPAAPADDEHSVIAKLPEIHTALIQAYRAGALRSDGNGIDAGAYAEAERIMRAWNLPDAAPAAQQAAPTECAYPNCTCASTYECEGGAAPAAAGTVGLDAKDAAQVDGWIAVAMISGEPTSVAFRDEATARAMCIEGEPFAFCMARSTAVLSDSKDAARYREVRKSAYKYAISNPTPGQLDEVVDAALTTQQAEGAKGEKA